MLVGLGAAMFSCAPDNDDDPVNPTPQPPVIRSTTDLMFCNLVLPEVPGSNAPVEVSVTAPNAYGDIRLTNVPYGIAKPVLLEWFGSDSTIGRANVRYKYVSSGTQIDATDNYDRTGGYWHFLIGSYYAPSRQNLRVIKRKYFDLPADTSRSTFAYINADPTHPQVKYYLNGVELGQADYGQLTNTVPAFTRTATDTLTTIDVATGRTIAKSEIGSALLKPVAVISLRALVGRRAGRPDTLIYRHNIHNQ